jgi:hypothetical protein
MWPCDIRSRRIRRSHIQIISSIESLQGVSPFGRAAGRICRRRRDYNPDAEGKTAHLSGFVFQVLESTRVILQAAHLSGFCFFKFNT